MLLLTHADRVCMKQLCNLGHEGTSCQNMQTPKVHTTAKTDITGNNKQHVCACRWGATPLQDALLEGHDLVCDLIRSFGGRLELQHAPKALGQAASAGDIRRISLLVENGVPVDLPDYDGRTALHLAATEGQLLSVYILLHRSDVYVSCAYI